MIDKDKIQVGDKVKSSMYIAEFPAGSVFEVVPEESLGNLWIDEGKIDIGEFDGVEEEFKLIRTNTKHTDVQEGDVVEVALVSEDKLKLWPTMEQLIGKTATVQRKGHQLELYFPEPISVPGFKEEQYEFIFDAHEIRVIKKKEDRRSVEVKENGDIKAYDLNGTLRSERSATLIAEYKEDGTPIMQIGVWEEPNCQVPIEPIPNTLRIGDELITGPIKSDGGSSFYYDLPLMGDLLEEIESRRVGDVSYIKTEELIQTVFKNNFSFGTLFKSLIRAQSVVDGVGKAGNDLEYECNKIIYYANQIKELYGNK